MACLLLAIKMATLTLLVAITCWVLPLLASSMCPNGTAAVESEFFQQHKEAMFYGWPVCAASLLRIASSLVSP